MTLQLRGGANPNPYGFVFTVDPGLIRGADSLPVPGGANGAMFARVRDSGTISKVALQVVTSSGNISIAAYRNSGTGRAAVPATRLATTGAVACPAVGYAELTLDATATLAPGDWLALSADNITATFRTMIGGTLDNNLGLGRQYRQPAVAHPLPATPTGLVATIGNSHVLIGIT